MSDSLGLRLVDWLLGFDWRRVKRTLAQVFGGVVIAFLLDWGTDGAVNVHSYVFGNSGLIIAGTTALAMWMNRPTTAPPARDGVNAVP
jgi:hypothetical protein